MKGPGDAANGLGVMQTHTCRCDVLRGPVRVNSEQLTLSFESASDLREMKWRLRTTGCYREIATVTEKSKKKTTNWININLLCCVL